MGIITPPITGRTIQFLPLEPRRLMSAVYPTIYEQYMVELYNWARANPNDAAARYGVALNEGPTAITLTADPKQPLAINPFLTDAARSYAQLLIDIDQFTHYANGTDPGSRINAAGYTNQSGYGENAGLNSLSFAGNEMNSVDTHFLNFYVDSTIAGRWHRLTMMNGDYKEVGSGHATGNWQGFNAFISVQDFAYRAGDSFLTGVAYTDTSNNDFYTPGEQLSGISVVAVRNSDGAQFSTTTWSSGGYTLQLAPGTYTVWGGGGSLGGWVRYNSVTIGDQNVKRDFRPDYVNSATGPGVDPPSNPPPPDYAQLNGGALTLQGTSGNDTFDLSVSGGTLSINRNGETATFTAANITSILILAGDGNDTVTLSAGVISTRVYGGAGNDSIQGGNGADILLGEAGDDTIYGGSGSDRIYGGDGDDVLDGQTYPDRIYGGDGNDAIFGGAHNDVLYGEAGNDSLYGQNQADYLDGGAGSDLMSGGRDIDTVNYASRTVGVIVQLSGDYSLPYGISGEPGELDNVLNDIENINGSAGDDRLIGSASDNVIHGMGGDDTVYGLLGEDYLYGDDGNDRIYANNLTRDHVNGGSGRDIVYADLIDLLSAVEVVM